MFIPPAPWKTAGSTDAFSDVIVNFELVTRLEPLHTTGESTPMATTSNYLALDLGAESGRGLLGRFDGQHLALEEAHRFPNGPVRMLDTLYWDLPRLFEEIKTALGKGASRGGELDGVGIDTWGVDFGLIGRGDTLLGNPVHYRDARTDGMLEAAFKRVPRERIYEITGLQFLPFNTVYQLLALSAVALATAGCRRDAADDARPLRLALDRPPRRRADRRLDNAVTRPAQRNLVRRAMPGAWITPRDLARVDRAGQRAGPAAIVGCRRGRPDSLRDGDRAGYARHGQCRGRRAGQDVRPRRQRRSDRTGATSARAPGRFWAWKFRIR